jgi:hypothetical protein
MLRVTRTSTKRFCALISYWPGIRVCLLTLGDSPLYGNCRTWIMSSLFSFNTYFHEISGMSLIPAPMA